MGKLDDVLWQLIPQDNRHWIEGKLIVFCGSMNLPVREIVDVASESFGMFSIIGNCMTTKPYTILWNIIRLWHHFISVQRNANPGHVTFQSDYHIRSSLTSTSWQLVFASAQFYQCLF